MSTIQSKEILLTPTQSRLQFFKLFRIRYRNVTPDIQSRHWAAFNLKCPSIRNRRNDSFGSGGSGVQGTSMNGIAFVPILRAPTLVLTVIVVIPEWYRTERLRQGCVVDKCENRKGTQDSQKLRWCCFRDVYSSYWEELKVHESKLLPEVECCSRDTWRRI